MILPLPSTFIADRQAGELANAIWDVAGRNWPTPPKTDPVRQPRLSPLYQPTAEEVAANEQQLGKSLWWAGAAADAKQREPSAKEKVLDQATTLIIGLRYSRKGVKATTVAYLSVRPDMCDPVQFRRKYLECPGLPLLGGTWDGAECVRRGVRYPAQMVNDLEHFFIAAESAMEGGNWLAWFRAVFWDMGLERLYRSGESDSRQFYQYDKTGMAFAAALGS